MKVKILEIRDSATMIPVVAIDMNPDNDIQRYYLRRLGFPCDGKPNIAMFHADAGGDQVWNDPYGWSGARTYRVAHDWIIQNWAALHDGFVVDVQFILGETDKVKLSERSSSEAG